MTAKFSLVTAALGAALVLAVPAFGQGQPAEPQWMQALEARSQELNGRYGLGQIGNVNPAIEARERAFSAGRDQTSAIDAREQALAAKLEAQLASSPSPDWFERVVAAHQPPRDPVVDDRFRIDPAGVPSTVTASSSDRSVQWPELGIGFLIGVAMALGLYFVVTREHEPAV